MVDGDRNSFDGNVAKAVSDGALNFRVGLVELHH